MRQYNLPDAHEMSVTREKRIFVHIAHTRTLICSYSLYHFPAIILIFFLEKQQKILDIHFSNIFEIFIIFPFTRVMYVLC